MRTCVITNPHARNGRAAHAAARCIAALRDGGMPVDVFEIEHFDDACTLARDACLAGVETIVAVGGDGTINRVLNGFFDDDGRRIGHARLGVVHTGTSPDFSRSYGLPLDAADAARAVLRARTRPIPVGIIRFGNGRTSAFACCANVGLGASLAARANAGIRARIGDTAGTLVSLLALLRTWDPATYDLTVDGRARGLTRVLNISVGITPYIASSIRVPWQVDPAHPRFYLLVLRDLTSRTLIPTLRRIYRGKPFANTDTLSLEPCTEVHVAAVPHDGTADGTAGGTAMHVQHANDVEHDGDPCGLLPCTISFSPDHLDLFH